MNTRQAEYKTDIGRLAEDMAKRQTQFLLTVFGMIVLAKAFPGFLIRHS